MTSSLGMGRTGMGSGRYGFGTPATTTAPGSAELEGGRDVDASTRDYSADATTGHLDRMSRTRQAVVLALTTTRGSAADPLFGVGEIPGVRTPRLDADVTTAVNEALDHLVVDGSIEVVGVEQRKTSQSTRAFFVVRWRDLETGEEHLTDV